LTILKKNFPKFYRFFDPTWPKNSESDRIRINSAYQDCTVKLKTDMIPISVADPDPDPHVFGPPGSGSTSQRYGFGSCSGSGSGSFYHHAKIVRKTLIPTIL
jgi:hypothetical protein